MVCRIYGVDFSSAPSKKKPITIATGELRNDRYCLEQVVAAPSLEWFERFLEHPGPWVAGFDLPFSMPRALIAHYSWPNQWPDFIEWYCAQPKEWLREQFRKFCNARPVGSKYVYRATDRPAGSSPAMRWTNPPVAWMTHAGAGRIYRAGLYVPGLSKGQDSKAQRRIALESYPGFTARKVCRDSYKSDTASKQTPARHAARMQILEALIDGRAGLSVPLMINSQWRKRMLEDGSGDLMDAAICALQAAHALSLPDFGFPKNLDPLEGWIASVPF